MFIGAATTTAAASDAIAIPFSRIAVNHAEENAVPALPVLVRNRKAAKRVNPYLLPVDQAKLGRVDFRHRVAVVVFDRVGCGRDCRFRTQQLTREHATLLVWLERVRGECPDEGTPYEILTVSRSAVAGVTATRLITDL